MRFSRLRLSGFKSFVDPTDMIIADGLTGIVGPNGCGKSNLLEALRWVMGENRPSTMRGDGMEDVIFAGTATRPARNFAEVAIHIDNAERLAPQGFNEADTLEITRRITRDAGSAYKANGRDVRARDVQMLFADASTGAHSPALVRQGQIAELINARPRARRRILEEAAGISGLYARRHEAELKLKGAEANLARVDDVIEQLAQQLGQLERQARQAARYREIGAALRQAEGTLLYRRWREADEAHAAARAMLTEAVTQAAGAERAARAASEARGKCEAALPPLREEEAIAAAILQRLVVERTALSDQERRARDAIASLEAGIARLAEDRAREVALNCDAGETIAALEAEAATLAEAAEGHEAAVAAAAEASHAAAQILSDREAALSQLTEDVARLAARHQSAQRLADDARTTLARNRGEADKARSDLAGAEARAASAAAGAEMAAKAQAEAAAAAARAEAALEAADDARSDAQSREAEARASRSGAEGEANALRAEVAALARLVDRDTTEGGQVLDLLRVAKGYEKALGAALADDLRAPAIEADGVSGWVNLPGYPQAQTLPEGVAGLASQVSVPEVLARRLSQVGLVPRAQGARLQASLKPGQRLVSIEGDLWRWDGFRAGAEDAPSAAALRLQQLNRLQELKQDVQEANARAEGAAGAHEALKARLARAVEADSAAREARKAADVAATEAGRALSRAEAERNTAEGQVETLGMSVTRLEEVALAAEARLGEAEAGLQDLGDLSALRAEVEDVKLTVEAARMTMLARRSGHDELRRDGEARSRRQTEIARQRDSWTKRLETAAGRIAELDARQSRGEADLAEARQVPDALAARREALSGDIATAEARRARAGDALARAETDLRVATETERATERTAGEAREARARHEALGDAARLGVDAARARILETMDCTPDALLGTLAQAPEEMPGAEAIEAEVARLKRSREALGAVNLRAEEDAVAVQGEHDALVAEKTDLEAAIRTLRGGIASLNREGRERLLTAFEAVNANFATLFTHLFGGGEASLVMVESEDPLEAGLEIMCQPPGKKLSTLSLLSGGEQTLTAMALIFAVFLANPAPICVLDEVDAPLDDANVTRFCDLLDEMTRRTQTRFMIITHHAVTMSRMDRLFGVTMGEQGVSQLVSVDLRAAERLVA